MKAQARVAVMICDYDLWSTLLNQYRAINGIGDLFSVPQGFPTYPFPCSPVASRQDPKIQKQLAVRIRLPESPPPRQSMTWAGPPGSWSSPLAWGPLTSENSPTGFYAGGRFGGGFGTNTASGLLVQTLGATDDSGLNNQGGNSYLTGGLFLGTKLFSAGGLGFGIEGGIDWAGKNRSLVSNVHNTVTATTTDNLQFEVNHTWSIGPTLTVPVTSKISLIGKGGWAWMDGTAYTGCVGSCVGAGTPTYNVATDVTLNGYYWGIGAQGRLGTMWDRSWYWRLDYTHYEFDSARIATGNPATAALAWNIQPSTDSIMFSFAMDFGTGPNGMFAPPMSWSADPVRFSDIRLKRDIVQIGTLSNGLALYRYKYTSGDPREFVGVMAQDVLEVVPAAVETTADGFYRVNYAMLGLKFQTWDEYQWSNTAAVQAIRTTECPATQKDFALIVAALPDALPVAH